MRYTANLMLGEPPLIARTEAGVDKQIEDNTPLIAVTVLVALGPATVIEVSKLIRRRSLGGKQDKH